MKYQFIISMLALPAISKRQDMNITQPINHELVFLRITTLKGNSILDFSLGGLYKNVTICMLG
jgi:hypothetical protein